MSKRASLRTLTVVFGVAAAFASNGATRTVVAPTREPVASPAPETTVVATPQADPIHPPIRPPTRH